MPLCFEDGMQYHCPAHGRLLAIIENDGGTVKVHFVSDISETLNVGHEKHDYPGVRKLHFPDLEKNFSEDGMAIFVLPDAAATIPEQIKTIVSQFVVALTRFEVDLAYTRKQTKHHRVILAFKPLPPLVSN